MTETLTEKLDKLIAKVEGKAIQQQENMLLSTGEDWRVAKRTKLEMAKVLTLLRTFRAEVEGKLLTDKEYDKIGSGWGFSIATDNKLRFFAGKGGRASVDTATEDEQVRDSKSVETSATRNKEAETKLT